MCYQVMLWRPSTRRRNTCLTETASLLTCFRYVLLFVISSLLIVDIDCQDSLGGNSKTMMIVTVCPSEITMEESLFTLQFATRARNIQLTSVKKWVSLGRFVLSGHSLVSSVVIWPCPSQEHVVEDFRGVFEVVEIGVEGTTEKEASFWGARWRYDKISECT